MDRIRLSMAARGKRGIQESACTRMQIKDDRGNPRAKSDRVRIGTLRDWQIESLREEGRTSFSFFFFLFSFFPPRRFGLADGEDDLGVARGAARGNRKSGMPGTRTRTRSVDILRRARASVYYNYSLGISRQFRRSTLH
jgi:hypothetical protein